MIWERHPQGPRIELDFAPRFRTLLIIFLKVVEYKVTSDIPDLCYGHGWILAILELLRTVCDMYGSSQLHEVWRKSASESISIWESTLEIWST